jgi:hypothetical protein
MTTIDKDDDSYRHEILRLGELRTVMAKGNGGGKEIEFDWWMKHHLKMKVKGKVCA